MRALKYSGRLVGSDGRGWFLTTVRHAFYDWYERNRPAEIVADDGTQLAGAVDSCAIAT